MSFEDFIAKYNGKGIDFDGAYGFQCMDLAHRYAIDVVGKDIPAVPAAKDEWNKTISGYDKIKNTPDGLPQKGDIVIWGTDIGAYGHIAVFLEGNLTTFTSFDQNWPVGSLCHKQSHNYKGVLGWFHPQTTLSDAVSVPKDTFESLVKKSSQLDNIADKYSFDKSGNIDKLVSEKITELEKTKQQIQNELDSCNISLTQAQNSIAGGSTTPASGGDNNGGINTSGSNPTISIGDNTGAVSSSPLGGGNSPEDSTQSNPVSKFLTFILSYIIKLFGGEK